MADTRSTSIASPRLVGQFLRGKRESVGMSQRALGLLFDPPVTTQFISNIERGVTPLPPVHIATLVRVLIFPESELIAVLEREYAVKISSRTGRPDFATMASIISGFSIAEEDRAYFQTLYDSFRKSDPKTREAFRALCHTLFHTLK